MNIYENSPTLVRYINYQPISVENGRSEGLAHARCAHASRKTADNMTSAFAQLHGCMQYIVTMGSVVVPYHPVINDMVLVRGATFDDVWKARVIAFNLPRKTLLGNFFTEKDGVWIPERGSQNQRISFHSILGVASGIWLTEYDRWQEI